ncbi:MAG: sigma-E processing peptidase SpoIIGA [Limnochordia bacterium]|nr:sigma-E processing peptidase SpoIIGA [Limnochordia bacterium]
MNSYIRVIYIDQLILWAIVNFLFDYLLLWATKEIARAKASRLRISLAAAFGTTYFILFRLSYYQAIPHYGFFGSLLTIFLVSLVMVCLCFLPQNRARTFRILAYFYLVFLISGGAGTLTALFLFGTPQDPNMVWGMLASVFSILLVAELGWGVIQDQLYQRVYKTKIQVQFGPATASCTALLDTGNNLRDPFSKVPVVVMELDVLEGILPREAVEFVRRTGKGDLAGIERLHSNKEWSTRFRCIPFSSLGKESGLLVGFRPDALWVDAGKTTIPIDSVVVALTCQRLAQDQSYQALIHPDVLKMTLEKPAQTLGPREGGKAVNATNY